MADAVCSQRGIPEHLHQDARRPDNAFDTTELLYRRVPLIIELGPSVSAAVFKTTSLPGMSVNPMAL